MVKDTKIAVVVPLIRGGVATLYQRITQGLRRDGFIVSTYNIGINIVRDLIYITSLTKNDVIIYIGSIAWPSAILLQLFKKYKGFNTIKALFVHGYMYHETLLTILKGNVTHYPGTLIRQILYEITKTLNVFDLYICPSIATCEMSRVPGDKRVILPLFFLDKDLRIYETLRSYREKDGRKKNKLRIMTYTSYAYSPKLLSTRHVISLGKILKRMLSNKFEIEIIIVDPHSKSYIEHNIKIIKPLDRFRYLRLVASSDLYLELSIDDEIRYSGLEAMAIGVPVAKVTHPLYREYIDYNEAIINAYSINELASKIVQIVKNNELYTYSQNAIKYIAEKRTWNYIKRDLYKRVLG